MITKIDAIVGYATKPAYVNPLPYEELIIQMSVPVVQSQWLDIHPNSHIEFTQRFVIRYISKLADNVSVELVGDYTYKATADTMPDFTNDNHLKGSFKNYTDRVIDDILFKMVESARFHISNGVSFTVTPDNFHRPFDELLSEVKNKLKFHHLPENLQLEER